MEVERGAEVSVSLQPLGAPPVGHVPDPEGLVVARREQVLAPGVPGDPADPVVVPHEGEEAHAGGHVPHADRLVPRARREEGADQPGLVGAGVPVGGGLGRLLDGRRGRLGRPGDALDHVVVVAELELAIFGGVGPEGERPDADGLVVGAGGDQRVAVDADHADPLAVAGVGAHAVAGGDLPDLDALVPGGGDEVVAGGEEADGADVVVVALERLHAVVGAVEVPDLDGHVRGARGEQLAAGGQVERDVLDRVGVTLKTEKKRVLWQFLQEMWTKGNTCVDVVNCENVACVKMLTDGHATCHAIFIASRNAFEGERNIARVQSMDAI